MYINCRFLGVGLLVTTVAYLSMSLQCIGRIGQVTQQLETDVLVRFTGIDRAWRINPVVLSPAVLPYISHFTSDGFCRAIKLLSASCSACLKCHLLKYAIITNGCEYREKDRINALTSAILPSYAPINHPPVRLGVIYDVTHYSTLALESCYPRVTVSIFS